MKIRPAILCLCLLQAWATSHAATIYSALGPDPYTPNFGTYVVGWAYYAPSQVSLGTGLATPFSFSGSAYQLQSITLGLGLSSTEVAPNFRIGISYDNGGVPSETSIAWLEPNPTLLTSERQLITYTFAMQTILQPDTPYWLVLGPSIVGVTSEDYNGEYSISTSILPSEYTVARRDFTDGSWGSWNNYQNSLSPAFRLDGIAVVPEPNTWALLALGGAAFAWAARRRHKR